MCLFSDELKNKIMKLHTQTLFVKEHGTGNCYQTTLACLLDVEIYHLPNIEAWFDFEDWFELLQNFLKQKFEVIEVASQDLIDWHINKSKGSVTPFPDRFENIEYMVSDLSPRGIQHVVIYRNGEMIHDCHPDRSGVIISEKCYCSYLEKISQ